jgi:hypothetical protein
MAVLHQDAGGYGGLMNTPLARPTYSDKIMMKYEERDFLAEITNSDITERITDCGQLVQILLPPEVSKWRNYQVNQSMVNGQVTLAAICLSICNAAYQSIKFDELTIHAACNNWEQFEQRFLEANYEAYVAFLREWVFGQMIANVSPRNQGPVAGQQGNINLGVTGTPKVVTRNTIPTELAYLRQVLAEYHHWVDNQMFLIVPPELQTVLVGSNFSNVSWVGNPTQSMIVDGAWSNPLMGFKVYETTYLPAVSDAGKICYPILAGHKDAYTFASNIIRSRLVQGIDTFSVMYQMLSVWGGACLYPHFLALGYWTFDPEG